MIGRVDVRSAAPMLLWAVAITVVWAWASAKERLGRRGDAARCARIRDRHWVPRIGGVTSAAELHQGDGVPGRVAPDPGRWPDPPPAGSSAAAGFRLF